ncbi:hypothetical protein ASZ90_019147 [hydrocarbon metagenome]|uniref:DUF86 domain-containing protein n=1 Tax=hydrocarbon metagenome TaxID=938273 RepID=A0A0W8E4E6_9ZZZZ
MTRDHRLYLEDMLEAINKIQRYTVNLTFDEFTLNEMAIDAVVRNFEIIGEAAGRISSNIQLLYPEIPWYEMKGMRNIVAHEYFRVDLQIIWKTVQDSLPELGRLIQSVLAKQQ